MEGDFARMGEQSRVLGDGVGAELVRIIRKIAQIERLLQMIEPIVAQLRSSDLFRLKAEELREEARRMRVVCSTPARESLAI